MNLRLRYLSTTLALVAVGLGYDLIQAKPWRPGPSLPPRPAAAGRPVTPPPVPPTAREVLDQADALSFTAGQKVQLEALDRRWKRDTAGLEAALQEAELEFSRFMRESQAGRGTTLQEIQRRSADVRELSAALRERRLLHGEAVARVLTEAQRRALGLLSSQGTSGGGR
jgi:hypothetical protein